MRGTHCPKMLFGVNLELHLSALLICLIFQSFRQVNASVGRYQSHLWPTSPFNTLLTLFNLFLFTCVDFIICCRILINFILFYFILFSLSTNCCDFNTKFLFGTNWLFGCDDWQLRFESCDSAVAERCSVQSQSICGSNLCVSRWQKQVYVDTC